MVKLVQQARDLGLLVLVMANYPGEDFTTASIAVVAASQFGADLIKMRLPKTTPTSAELAHLRRVISGAPPTLVAGGSADVDLTRTLALAREVGMKGTCIGRHYFDRAERATAIRTVLRTFPGDKGASVT
jgi:DhnA family fructose-bisphosphate aldolase class Ia